ncbi:unknown [Lactobacillus phage Lb338-1]|uniref:Uncharacterized protein n=1 Tax=Lactobacillus phage Lb338-1 TaxID=2892342 RepID=C1KFF8_9CAUD|nr:hypothetical protein lb338_phage_48 [Lactobacillus phage Lb338-1]ACO36969.1 unknown [Lactobacillus phage Lb338-1]
MGSASYCDIRHRTGWVGNRRPVGNKPASPCGSSWGNTGTLQLP